MKNYNLYLISLRENKGLTIKEAAKQMGISRTTLFCYEKGYFRPNKKNLEKINKFYEIELSLKGLDGYPAASKEHLMGKRSKNLKGKRIAFGIVSAFFALVITAGALLFSRSVNNTNEFYGQTYQDVRNAVISKGSTGHDIVTGMEYYYVSDSVNEADGSTAMFYQSNNILYFNDFTYSKTIMDESTLSFERFVYQFGGNLGVNSYLCRFTFGDVLFGTHFTCSFVFDGNAVSEVSNVKIVTEGLYTEIDQHYLLLKVNKGAGEINAAFSQLLSNVSGKSVDFYSDFLPAREQGRVMNFILQIVGLVLLFVGITFFFIFFSIFLRLLFANIKPRLISATPTSEENSKIPDDWNIHVGIPDAVIIIFGRIVRFASIVLFILALLATLKIPALSALANPVLLETFKTAWVMSIFLDFFITVSRIRKPADLIRKLLYNLAMFLYIATVETVVLAIVTAWGYDLKGLVYKYVPGNVFQVVAINYIILLFLFFQPAFLDNKKKYVRFLWHSLSLIPLGALITIYYFSNRYAMVYGVEENILINFWFPNSYLLLSVVSVVFMYIVFFLRLFYERKYGMHNSQIFFHGDKFSLIQNIVCASLIILVTSLDFIFVHNQQAHYLGLGHNYWMFILVPFILLCKYSPNNQQTFLFEYEFERYLEKEAS